MSRDTFHLRKASESLKLIRPKLDARLVSISEEMSTLADRLDRLRPADRAAMLAMIVPTAEELVDSLSELASKWPDPLPDLEEAAAYG